MVQDTAYAVASTYLTFSLLFCGFYVAIPNMVLSVARALSWASFSKYTFEALMQNEFQNRTWSEPCSTSTSTSAREPVLPCIHLSCKPYAQSISHDHSITEHKSQQRLLSHA